MTCKRWKLMSSIVLTFCIQRAFAGEGWLLITSKPPRATISVDDVYRGVTPERLGDALRVKVPAGVREISARVQVNGKEYAVKQTVKARQARETSVQLNLRMESACASALPGTSIIHVDKPKHGLVFPFGHLEVPGKNF